VAATLQNIRIGITRRHLLGIGGIEPFGKEVLRRGTVLDTGKWGWKKEVHFGSGELLDQHIAIFVANLLDSVGDTFFQVS
jgi:hypothetical protein